MTWVDPDMLHAGAKMTGVAGDGVGRGADDLSAAAVPGGMFGDFAVAHDFHTELQGQHGRHVARMREHHQALNDIGTKAHTAARDFVAVDEANAATIASVAAALGE